MPYLHFGYMPPKEPKFPFDTPVKFKQIPMDFEQAALQSGEVLSRVIHSCISPGQTHYIPLSGGLDSRALLAGALEAGIDIETLTFGVPGTMDFDFGTQVAKFSGCRHNCINLLEHLPDTTALVDAVCSGSRWTYTFDAYFNRLLTQQMGSQPIVLNGFMGDPVAGSHLKPHRSDNLAVIAFLDSQRFGPKMRLYPRIAEASNWLPAIDAIPNIVGLTAYERLDFSIRQMAAIRPIVVDERADVRTPFTHQDWLEQMFSAPAEWRRGCALYEAALVLRWPGLFSLPTKNHLGLGLDSFKPLRSLYRGSLRVFARVNSLFGRESWLNRSRHNYLNFSEAFSEPGPLQQIAKENLADLEARGVVPWLAPKRLLVDHINGYANYERELQILIGLEINLKSLELS